MNKLQSLEDLQKYLSTLGEFLEKWKWLVLTRPTHILVERILDSHSDLIISVSSLSLEEQRDLLMGRSQFSASSVPYDFFSCISKLTFPVDTLKVSDSESFLLPKKSSVKKGHETSRLSSLISSMASEQPFDCIVDIGSGLGYVDRELCRVLEDCIVLAVESESARCKTADATNQQHGLGHRIVQIPLKFHDANVNNMVSCIKESANGPCCLVALHACGDLTPSALRLFQQCSTIQCAVILSCCYHKMCRTTDGGKGSFANFPSSEYLKKAFASGSVDPDLADVSFLRLAAESTKELWAARSLEQLQLHARSVAFRALIQLYETNIDEDVPFKAPHRTGVRFVKKVRKTVKSSLRENWSSYITAWLNNTEVQGPDGESIDPKTIRTELERLSSEFDVEEIVRKTMGYNTLKTSIQHLSESFVLVDRLLALREVGLAESYLVRVLDPALSPRSIAIVVKR